MRTQKESSVSEVVYRVGTANVNQIVANLVENKMELEGINVYHYAEKLRTFSTLFEAWYGCKLIGLCACYLNNFSEQIAYISHLAIDVNFRRLGAGGMLLKMVVNACTKYGFNSIRLEVYKDNFDARSFYLKSGFVDIDDHGNKFLMEKSLKLN